MLQLDVGTCLEAGSDPVAWIRANPGRIRSLHLKDWSPDPGKGYKVLFGEGAGDWKNIFAAAERTGDAEYYLMEQEGSRYSELDTAQRCLESFDFGLGVSSREWELNPRPADCSRNSMLLNRLALSCVLHHGFPRYSGLAVPLLFPNPKT